MAPYETVRNFMVQAEKLLLPSTRNWSRTHLTNTSSLLKTSRTSGDSRTPAEVRPSGKLPHRPTSRSTHQPFQPPPPETGHLPPRGLERSAIEVCTDPAWTQPGGAQEPKLSEASLAGLIGSLQDALRRAERMAEPKLSNRASPSRLEPAWRRANQGEHRLVVALAVVVAIGLELILPQEFMIRPRWLLPTLEVALLIGLVAANPDRINRTSRALRTGSVALIALISLANAWSSGELINSLINGTAGQNAALLLARGASVYVTNIIVFALWYWEWDRGGPVSRAKGLRRYPDFMFPQMTHPELAPPDWVPAFLDYLYLSFTNATAFSPTDVMPLAKWPKMLMLLQSAVSLLTVAMIVARAVNILN